MNCINCKVSISSWAQGICTDCRFNYDVMISLIDVFVCYRITDEELAKANLFKITFTFHGNRGTKYLKSQVHELARTLTMKSDDDNPRKQAFLRFDEYYKEQKAKKEDHENRLETVKSICLDLLRKCDVEMVPEIEKYFNEQIKENEYIDLDEFHKAMMITNKVYNKYITIIRKINAKKELDELIKNNFDCRYHEFVKRQNNTECTEIYKKCTEHCTLSVNEAFKKIKKIVDRKKAIDTLIDEGINDVYLKRAYDSNMYNEYMSFGSITAVEAFDTIVKRIEMENTRNDRLTELKKLLKKNKITLTFARTTKYFHDYIDMCLGTANDVIDNIKKREQEKEIEDRVYYIEIKIGPMQSCTYKQLPIYVEYINTGVPDTDIVVGKIKYLQLKYLDGSIPQKWEDWLIANPSSRYSNECLRFDILLFNFYDSYNGSITITNNGNAAMDYVESRCKQLGLEYRTSSRSGNNTIVITKKTRNYLLKIEKNIL